MADQSFLNLLYLDQVVEMTRWPAGAIRHRDWDTAIGARLLHFPCSRREQMQRYRQIGTAGEHVIEA
jgi:hypothetical protein